MIRVYIESTETEEGYYDNILWIENELDRFLVGFNESTVTPFKGLPGGKELAKILGVELELVGP